ncbi:MAG: TonB-dependent receptor [Flavobacteriales bacterium]
MKKLFFMPALVLSFFQGMAQYSVSGIITGEQEPLAGAIVKMPSSLTGTATNANGEYKITRLSDGVYALEFSFVGYQTHRQEITISGQDIALNIQLKPKTYLVDEFLVTATRADNFTPVAKTNVSKEEISALNLGQDIPYLLNFQPSVVSSSDAGAGVGYTSMRIRGSDQTRINVTINGIPYNDSESQGVFWVNMPDFASSLNSVQIQRGVGASTNGAGAFGATMNLQTDLIEEKAYGEVNNSFGSFNTRKHTVKFGSGLINNHWAFEGRLSRLASDGYIDRAFSNMSSYYVSGGYYGEKVTVKMLAFGGEQQVYQAWDGIDKATLDTNRRFNFIGAIYDENGNISGFYDNETDNYRQDHYQLHVVKKLSDRLAVNLAGHYTYGRGYFEQFRQNDRFNRYDLEPIQVDSTTVINRSDLIRRRWLNNHFCGGTYSLNYKKNKLNLIVGGGFHQYDGDHFGEVIWARYASQSNIRHRYYDNFGQKSDFNNYARANYLLSEKLDFYTDMQYRMVSYSVDGTDNSLTQINVNETMKFFNPKMGMGYNLSKNDRFFASFSMAGREPNRRDFVDNPNNTELKPETLYDIEVGYTRNSKSYQLNVNYYYMYYINQLVLTGEINDVGGFLRTNSGESFRTGIEIDLAWKINKYLSWRPNATFSLNRNIDFKEVVNDTLINYGNTAIVYSPNIIMGSQFVISPVENVQLVLMSKYVGEQYLSNLGSEESLLKAYFVQDVRLAWQIKTKMATKIELNLMVNNILNRMYVSNGYMWGPYAYYYPQAGINFLGGLNLRF